MTLAPAKLCSCGSAITRIVVASPRAGGVGFSWDELQPEKPIAKQKRTSLAKHTHRLACSFIARFFRTSHDLKSTLDPVDVPNQPKREKSKFRDRSKVGLAFGVPLFLSGTIGSGQLPQGPKLSLFELGPYRRTVFDSLGHVSVRHIQRLTCPQDASQSTTAPL